MTNAKEGGATPRVEEFIMRPMMASPSSLGEWMDFARTLERELEAVRAERDAARKLLGSICALIQEHACK